jgi:hypothetical protein
LHLTHKVTFSMFPPLFLTLEKEEDFNAKKNIVDGIGAGGVGCVGVTRLVKNS